MDVLIDSFTENIALILTFVATLMGFLAKNTSIINKLTSNLGAKANSVDVKELKDKQDKVEKALNSILELQELYATFQSEYSQILPDDYKEKYKEILSRIHEG